MGADASVQGRDRETQLPDRPKPSEGLVHQGSASLDTNPPHPVEDRQFAGRFEVDHEDRENGGLPSGISGRASPAGSFLTRIKTSYFQSD